MAETMLQSFVQWFQRNGGAVDLNSVGFTTFPISEGGRGAVALQDIPEGHILFSIPRSLILSTSTSPLPVHFGKQVWNNMKMDQGWAGLILCMMWENANGPSSRWTDYLATLPTQFNTPMFWSDDDLAELEGTSVVEKLGREEAEQSYTNKALPAIQSRPDLFPPTQAEYYSLANYHLMGSRVLSRSFNVEKWELEGHARTLDVTTDSRADGPDMNPDFTEGADENTDHMRVEQAEEEGEEEDSSDTAMVPMADMLNARYGSENAKLFDDEDELRMVSTKPIKAGEQIWNTYGDLPNSELLRRYGHVDLLPLPQGGIGNPGDVAEIRADIIVSTTRQQLPSRSSESLQERIEWWLEQGGDDVFVLESDLEIPELLVSFIRLLSQEPSEWETTKARSKPPKPKTDALTLRIVLGVLEARIKMYPTSLQADESSLNEQSLESDFTNKKLAMLVRIGEKQILNRTLNRILDLQVQSEGTKTNKRKGGSSDSGTQKRAKK